ncbi:MAG: copper transporter [Betaproteobacteria bacterium]
MIDMKWHVASLVAVFLALGVGILVGSAMVTDSALVERQEQMIDRLEEDFAALKAERDGLGTRLAASERALAASLDFENTVVASLTRGKLSGKRVAVVVCRDAMPAEEVERMGRAIVDAGGELVRVVNVLGSFAPAPSRQAMEVASSLGVPASRAEAVGQEAASALASYLVAGETAPLLNSLLSLGYVSLVGQDPPCAEGRGDAADAAQGGGRGERADAVVLVVGSSDPAFTSADAGIPIVRAVKALRVDVVGVEGWNVKVSQVADYKREGISTVDCADLPLGRLSLVYALAGWGGHFGIKDGSEIRVPDLWGPPQ